MKFVDKPIILAIESTAATCGVALSDGETIIGSYSLFGKNLHDKLLAELIKRLLNDTETSIDDVSAVALSAGPGSFTGLRIGAAVAKGICIENKPKLIAIPTMKSLALAATQRLISENALSDLKPDRNNKLVIILPFYKDQYYLQVFDNYLNEIKPIEVIDSNFLENFETLVVSGFKPETNRYIFVSPDNTLNNIFKESYYFMPLLPDFIAQMGYLMFQREDFILSEEFVPLYVKEFIPKFKVIT
jgi:tRNA threonylcarbamoyladenosine biosynthesis protein TsaB